MVRGEKYHYHARVRRHNQPNVIRYIGWKVAGLVRRGHIVKILWDPRAHLLLAHDAQHLLARLLAGRLVERNHLQKFPHIPRARESVRMLAFKVEAFDIGVRQFVRKTAREKLFRRQLGPTGITGFAQYAKPSERRSGPSDVI